MVGLQSRCPLRRCASSPQCDTAKFRLRHYRCCGSVAEVLSDVVARWDRARHVRRATPSPATELRAIKRYLAARTDTMPWMFASEREAPLTRQAVNYIVRPRGLSALHRQWHARRGASGDVGPIRGCRRGRCASRPDDGGDLVSRSHWRPRAATGRARYHDVDVEADAIVETCTLAPSRHLGTGG